MSNDDIHDLDKRLALLELRVEQIASNIEKIANALSWLAKITGASLVGAVIAWIVRGGLSG
jgi:hypothetical protein